MRFYAILVGGKIHVNILMSRILCDAYMHLPILIFHQKTAGAAATARRGRFPAGRLKGSSSGETETSTEGNRSAGEAGRGQETVRCSGG